MLLVVYYHTFYYTYGYRPSNDIIGGMEVVLHIGVAMFVLLSGYFGIKPSVAGGGELLGRWFLYFVPLIIVKNTCHPSEIHNFNPFFFITDSPYWFMQSYLALYLIAPVLNAYLKDCSKKQMAYTLTVLFFINTYWGVVGDFSYLREGKNLINFMMIYVIGCSLKVWRIEIRQIKVFWIILFYLLLNLSIFVLYVIGDDNIQTEILILAYNYSSPLLIINAMLLFVVLSHIQLKSKCINYIASSTLAVYLIHVHPIICGSIFKMPLMYIYNNLDNTILICLIYFVFAVLFFALCILIDKSLSPVWNYFARCIDKINSRNS